MAYKRKETELNIDDNGVAKVEVIPGSLFIIKKEVFLKVGGFDIGTFLYEEENILAIKIRSLGMTNAISVDDKYNHNHKKKRKIYIIYHMNMDAKIFKKILENNPGIYIKILYHDQWDLSQEI